MIFPEFKKLTELVSLNLHRKLPPEPAPLNLQF